MLCFQSFLGKGGIYIQLHIIVNVFYSAFTNVHCDKTEERSVLIFIPYERSFSLVF